MNSGYADATIQQCLDMTVALDFSENYSDPDSEIQRLDRVAGWRMKVPGDESGIREFLMTVKKSGDHGSQFQYCSSNTDVLAWVLEEVLQRPYPEIVSENLWAPIGAEREAIITLDALGAPLANGGILATTRDLARIGRLILDRGTVGGNELVHPGWIDATYTGAEARVRSVDYLQALHPGGSYKNQWWITNNEDQEIYAVGIYGQYLWVNRTTRTVIVKYSTLPVAVSAEYSQRHIDLFKALSRKHRPSELVD